MVKITSRNKTVTYDTIYGQNNFLRKHDWQNDHLMQNFAFIAKD